MASQHLRENGLRKAIARGDTAVLQAAVSELLTLRLRYARLSVGVDALLTDVLDRGLRGLDEDQRARERIARDMARLLHLLTPAEKEAADGAGDGDPPPGE